MTTTHAAPQVRICACNCHAGGAYRPSCSVDGGCGSIGCDERGTLAGSPAPTCEVCERRNPRPDRICQACRDRGAANLDDLPGIVRRLELELVPTGGIGERVSSSSPHSRPAASLAAMNLRVSSPTLDADRPWWYHPVADLDAGDDIDGPMQTGMPSIPAWIRAWAREWRDRNEHLTCLRQVRERLDQNEMPARPPRPPQPADDDASAWRDYADALVRWRQAMSAWRHEVTEVVERGARATLGLGDALPRRERPKDPLADAWEIRYGTAAEHFALGRDAGYLRTWLGRACDDSDLHPDAPEFLLGLRTLHKAAMTLLEGRPMDWYCGRCPEVHYDRDTGAQQVCAANLWLNPYTTVLICPRCRAETRREKGDFLHLRAKQLDRWTEDELREPTRRRRAGAGR